MSGQLPFMIQLHLSYDVICLDTIFLYVVFDLFVSTHKQDRSVIFLLKYDPGFGVSLFEWMDEWCFCHPPPHFGEMWKASMIIFKRYLCSKNYYFIVIDEEEGIVL